MKSEDEKSSLLGGEKPVSPIQMGEEMRASGGARPKVRSPKEVKTRRFVIKQAKAISRTQLLESVSETEEGPHQTLLQSSLDSQDHRSQKTSSRCPEFFGVKSYVHTFYEAMAMDTPEAYENTGYSSIGSLMPSRKRRRNYCLKVFVWIGVVLLIVGFVALLVGFLVSKRNAVVDVQEDIAVINRADLNFNRNIDACKIAGIVMFCAGGIITSVVMVLLLFIRRQRTEDENPNQVIRVMNEEEEEEEECPPKTTIEAKVPVTEEIASVQPRRSGTDEVVMTNAGLCKVPS